MKKSTNPYLQTRDISGKFIFICYSHFDREIMEPIAEKLAKDGYRFWFDDGTRSGEAWQKIVSKEIRKCTVFLFLISENTMQSDNCRDELTYAKNNRKTIVPVFLSKVTLESYENGVDFQLVNCDPINFYEYEKDELPFFFKTLYDSKNINLCKRSDKEQHEFLKKIGQTDNFDSKEVADKTEENFEPIQPIKPVVMNSPVENTDGGHDDEAYNILSRMFGDASSDTEKTPENSFSGAVMHEEPENSGKSSFNESKDRTTGKTGSSENVISQAFPEKPSFDEKPKFTKETPENTEKSINSSSEKTAGTSYGVGTMPKCRNGAYTTSTKKVRNIVISICFFIAAILTAITVFSYVTNGDLRIFDKKAELTEEMFWGEKECADRNIFLSRVSFQKVIVDSSEIEISAVPFYTNVDPTCKGYMLLGFLDRFGKEYYFYGGYSIYKNSLSLSHDAVQFNLSDNGNDEAATPEQAYADKGRKLLFGMTFFVYLRNGEIQLQSEEFLSSLVILKNKQKNTNGYFTLRGTATKDCFNELKYISISYSPGGDAKVEKLMFDDSGTPLNASVKYTPEENRIAIKWTEEIREYNGRMETFPNGGNASFQFVNTAPYGFVLIDDENTVYSYQAEADPAFFESDTEN